MIPTLHISKLERGAYEARLVDGGQEIGELTLHGSIAEALKHVGVGFPKAWADFVEVQYVDVSLGTQPLRRLAIESAVLADQLVALAAEVWQSEEERAAQASTA